LIHGNQAWTKKVDNLQRKRFDEAYTRPLETGKAWAYKKMLRDLWHHGKPEVATHFFKYWYYRVIHTNLEPLKKVARTIKEHLPNVACYCPLGITNTVAEGINSNIMAIKRRVGGFRNRKKSKTAIYSYCGGLNLTHPHFGPFSMLVFYT
jgi:transposase